MTHTIKKILLSAAIGLALQGAHAADASTARMSFNIEPQPLRKALANLAEQTGLQILQREEDSSADGITAPGVVGTLSTREALERLLQNSGLNYEFLNEKTVRITAAKMETADAWSSADTDDLRLSNLQASQMYVAQNDNAVVSSSAESGEKLEEVVVTAQRRKEVLQDVPISITAIGKRELEASGAVDVKDVLGTVPGLSYGDGERGLSRYAIRGISGNLPSPTVGVYLDDVSLVTESQLFSGALDAILFDMERVEVLKGPQGTLYGGSAMGGAIKYVTARPDLSEFEGSVAAGVSATQDGDESYTAQGVINVPLVADALALRAGVYSSREGGYIDNVANLNIENTQYSSTPSPVYTPLEQASLSARTQDDVNSAETLAARVSLLWQPDETLSIRPLVLYQDTSLDDRPYFFTNLSPLTASFRLEQPVDDKTILASLDVNKDFGWAELTSVTAYIDRKVEDTRDYSFYVGGLAPSFFGNDTLSYVPREFETFSQEVRLASPSDSSSSLSWLIGAYASKQDVTQNSRVDIFGVGPAFYADNLAQRDESAIFGEATYALTDSLRFTAGVRLFRNNFELDSDNFGIFAGGDPLPVHIESSEDGVSPKFVLAYDLNDDHLVYASATKGFRPGGPSDPDSLPDSQGCNDDLALFGLSDAPSGYKSDSLWTYELGSKNGFKQGNFVLNAAGYYTDWSEIQQTVLLPRCGLGVTLNAGAARIIGAELEARLNVTSNLQFGGNLTYTDAEITDPGPIVFAHEGDEVLDTPTRMASAFANYSIPLGRTWSLDLNANYQYRSGQRRSFSRTQGVTYTGDFTAWGSVPYGAEFQEGYEIVNLRAIFSNGDTQFRLFVNNALNERPLLDQRLDFGSSRASTLRPRTIGVELRRRF